MQRKSNSHSDLLNLYYKNDDVLNTDESLTRNITFIVTDACQLRCTYCYEGDKCNHYMTEDIAKKGVDLLFDMYYANDNPFINQKTKGIILEFIGGEPLMNIDIIDYICSYFFDRCFNEKHIWGITSRISMSSNGVYYSNQKVQHFLKKFKNKISFQISIDGPKEIHDKCRVFPDGKTGSFDLALSAQEDYCRKFNSSFQTKVTISPDNMVNMKSIIEFFFNKGANEVNLNCIFEHPWSIEDGKVLYKSAKEAADYLLELDDIDKSVSFFSEQIGYPIPENNLECFCGGSGKMLAINWDGKLYPCTRFCPTSIGTEVKELTLGTVDAGFVPDDYSKNVLKDLKSVTRRTKCDDECFYCSIAQGCADCEAWNYQSSGDLNCKSKNICNTHKVRCIINTYYWNSFYMKHNLPIYFELNLSEEECLKFIDKQEYDMIKSLIRKC